MVAFESNLPEAQVQPFVDLLAEGQVGHQRIWECVSPECVEKTPRIGLTGGFLSANAQMCAASWGQNNVHDQTWQRRQSVPRFASWGMVADRPAVATFSSRDIISTHLKHRPATK